MSSSRVASGSFGTAKENMASRFATSTEEEIERLLIDTDAENTTRSTKVAKELFHEYLRENLFMWKHEKKKDKTMYNRTIVRLGFCDIRNNQGLSKCYQLRLITLTLSTNNIHK